MAGRTTITKDLERRLTGFDSLAPSQREALCESIVCDIERLIREAMAAERASSGAPERTAAGA